MSNNKIQWIKFHFVVSKITFRLVCVIELSTLYSGLLLVKVRIRGVTTSTYRTMLN